MTELKPELIEIIEGPTPEFIPSPQVWLESLLESPEEREAAMVQLRTMNGASIMERCQTAWKENRPVRLDFPDEVRARQQVDVIAMRLKKMEEGPLLMLWVSFPVEYNISDEDIEAGMEEWDDEDMEDWDDDDLSDMDAGEWFEDDDDLPF